MRRAAVQIAPLIVLAAVLSTGCGHALRKQQAQQLADADALFVRGCYRCLRSAFDTYAALRLAGYQPALVTAKAFDTAILLAAREKELAMPAEPWIEKAEELAAREEVPRPSATLYLEMVRALPWALGRFDRDEQPDTKPAGPILDALDGWEAALGPAASRPIVATYLSAALRCTYTPAHQQDQLTAEALTPAHRDAPLIKYVAGSCRPELRSELADLANDPDFHEVTYQHGRLRLYEGGSEVHLDARVMLDAAHAAMPEAIANTYVLAGVLAALEAYEACAAMYDEVITRGGAAHESMLNRTECLTRGAKRREAIVSATELIDSPGILRGEAFFWRAWNRYHLKELPAARADVEAAKPLFREADLYALSGFIAYDMDQKDYAYTEFGEAVRLRRRYCVALFYQGLIDAQHERWKPAADRYLRATGCYDASARGLLGELSVAEGLPLDNPTRQRRIDNLTEALDAEKLQLARAAYNTAYSYGRLGDPEAGIPFALKAAATHKEMEKLANELLAILR